MTALQQHRKTPATGDYKYPDPRSADDHLVTDLPGLLDAINSGRTGGVPVPTLHAGHVRTVPAGQKDVRKLFYWLVSPEALEGETDVAVPPLVIWLNGGPGCSSNDGFFLENGPFRLSADPPGDPAVDGGYVDMKSGQKVELSFNPHSWHRSPAYVMYVDQPVGTGLSFTTNGRYCKTDEEVNADFYGFLVNFLTLHADKFLEPDGEGALALNRPLYFSGESHAGHYIPSMVDYIRKKNEDGPDVFVSVAGAAIGNGWFDPYHQYAGTEVGLAEGFIDMAQARAIDIQERTCQAKLEQGNSEGCWNLLRFLDGTARKSASMYDTRLFIQRGHFPAGKHVVEAYLGGINREPARSNSKKVLKAIHATQAATAGQQYLECTDPPYDALSHLDGVGVVDEIGRMLDDGVRLLFFNGMNDVVCNHVRNEMAIELLPWENITKWQEADRYAWDGSGKATGAPAGYMKEFENLLYLKIKDSGHMVPMDQPERALDMIRTFIYERSFQEGRQQALSASVNGETCPSCPSCQAKKNLLKVKLEAMMLPQDQVVENVTVPSASSRTMYFAVFLLMIGLLGLGYAVVLVNSNKTHGSIVYNVVEKNDWDEGDDAQEIALESEYGETSSVSNIVPDGSAYRRGAAEIGE